jgi:hypothetical protein
MALTAYLCAFYNLRDDNNYHWDQDRALRDLVGLKKAVDTYRQENGRYPEDLVDLKKGPPPADWIDSDGSVPDPWNNAYQYRPEQDGYSILSMGRDGKLGGEVFDHDLVVTHLSPDGDRLDWKQAVGLPTLHQFTLDYPTKGIQLACALAGVCAFAACLLTLMTGQATPKSSLAGLILTLLFCLWFAVNISAIHVPSHH